MNQREFCVTQSGAISSGGMYGSNITDSCGRSPVIAMYGMYDGNNTFCVENDGLTYGDHINDVITIYYSYGNFIFL